MYKQSDSRRLMTARWQQFDTISAASVLMTVIMIFGHEFYFIAYEVMFYITSKPGIYFKYFCCLFPHLSSVFPKK